MANTSHHPSRRSLISPTLRRLWGYVTPHRASLFAGLACAGIGAGIQAGYAKLLSMVIQAIEKKHDTSRLDHLGLLILGVFLVRAFFSFGQSFLISNAMQKVTRDLRNAVYAHIHGLPLSFFEGRGTGQLMSSITSDVPVVADTFQGSLTDAIQAPIVMACAFGYMLYLSWKLTLILFVVVPLMGIVIQKAKRSMGAASNQIQARLQDISEILSETFSGVRIVKSFNAEETEVRRFRRTTQETQRSAMRAVRVQAALSPTVDFIAMGGFVLVLWAGGRLVTNGDGKFGFPELAAFLFAVNLVGNSVKSIGSISMSLRRLEAAAVRIFALLDTKSDLVEKPDAVALARAEGDVAFRNVHFAYGTGPEVLHGISFHARPGEVIAFVGPSGAGKTTIANLVPRFYDITGGAVLVDGHDVRDVQLSSLRKQIGIVPQETLLFSGSVRDNIRYGRPDASEEEVRAAAKAANADLFIESLPEGYDTLVGERGAKLSGGQRQRVAIARALLKDPRILILDEATSALDTESETLVQEALNQLMQGRTTLVIAHRLSTIRNADRIVVMQAGRIVEEGTHNELLAQSGLYARLYEMQFKRAISHQPSAVSTEADGMAEEDGRG